MNICKICKQKTDDFISEEELITCTDCLIESVNKDKKKRLFRVLDKYGVLQDYKTRFVNAKYRDALFKDILVIMGRE